VALDLGLIVALVEVLAALRFQVIEQRLGGGRSNGKSDGSEKPATIEILFIGTPPEDGRLECRSTR
jgi:hypothetical protein